MRDRLRHAAPLRRNLPSSAPGCSPPPDSRSSSFESRGRLPCSPSPSGISHCDAGIMITASHNPPSDNGFKCYGRAGGQVIPPDDPGIIDCVEAASDREIPEKPFAEALADGSIVWVGRRGRRRLYHRGRQRVGLPRARHLDRLHAVARRGRNLGRQGADDGWISAGSHPRVAAHARRRFPQRARPRCQPGDIPELSKRRSPRPERKAPTSCWRVIPTPIESASPFPGGDPKRRVDHLGRQPDRRLARGFRDQGNRSTGKLRSDHYLVTTLVSSPMARALAHVREFVSRMICWSDSSGSPAGSRRQATPASCSPSRNRTAT